MPALNFPGGVSGLNFGGGGVWSDPWGGVCSKFSGVGVSAPNFRGGLSSKFLGGVWSGGGVSPIFGIRSTFGRYASYWNPFLLLLEFEFI